MSAVLHDLLTRARHRWLAAAAVLTLAVGAGCGSSNARATGQSAGQSSAGQSARRSSSQITVANVPVGQPVPGGFVGISMEYRGLEAYLGTDPKALSPAFLQLLRNLAPDQRPVLRIGGDSTDWTWYPVPGMRQPPGVKYSLTPDWMRVAHAVTQALGARLILGVNLEADSSRLASVMARALIDGVGRSSIEALELGNEPELYGALGWYRSAAGVEVRGRPRGYGFAGYASDLATFARALPRFPLAGPSTGAPVILDQLGTLLAGPPRLGLVTLHAYPLKHCTRSTVVTSAQLLSDSSSDGLAASLAPQIATARRHGLGVRIDEVNGVSCGGTRGVSNTFASALWSLDALFAMARAGVDGVNIHTVPNTLNEVIGSSQVNGDWQAAVHPEYYGMMMFAQAAPAGSRLLHIAEPANTAVKVWATRAPDGHVRVVLINRGARAQTVAVRIPSGHGPAQLERLTAPSLTATSGVTLGGQSFGAQTTTGLLAGDSDGSSVTPSGGSYSVTLPGTSAAMLTS